VRGQRSGGVLGKAPVRVAAGMPRAVKELPPFRGHVIECRVNAEDPARNFQPSPGRLEVFHQPGGPGVRIDTHAYAGYTVPPFYDSMIAKLIVQGSTREEALKRMQIALESFVVEGVKTTMPFLARVMQHPGFQAGKVHTKWLEFEGADLLKEPG
ncbi:MAG: acetyl-CoA carboxylase biotin carboxylase subunit, partial [Gemmatimonadaceae bacterium]|nr:acetyl-CoA carboxylase biotin carboxylase subunit [Gemmatimonadaceae bacterium]